MVVFKLAVLAFFVIVAFVTAFTVSNLVDFAPQGPTAGSTPPR